jgi:hypothetical protein
MSDNCGSGIAVGSGVGTGVGCGAQAARAIIATSNIESKLKGFIFFSCFVCKMFCTTYDRILYIL